MSRICDETVLMVPWVFSEHSNVHVCLRPFYGQRNSSKCRGVNQKSTLTSNFCFVSNVNIQINIFNKWLFLSLHIYICHFWLYCDHRISLPCAIHILNWRSTILSVLEVFDCWFIYTLTETAVLCISWWTKTYFLLKSLAVIYLD